MGGDTHVGIVEVGFGSEAPQQDFAHAFFVVGSIACDLYMPVVRTTVSGQVCRRVVVIGIIGKLQLLGALAEVVGCVVFGLYGLKGRVVVELAPHLVFELGH